jgi:flagellar FliJ protein
MKRFVWRLQRVLDVKKKEEQVKKMELLRLTEKLTQKRSELLIEKRILQDIIKELSRKNPRERLGEQELFLKHSKTANDLIRKLEEQARELELQQRQKIAEVVKLRRFREGLEKLRAQAKANFIREQEKLEQKELDEMAAIGFVRKTDPVLRQIAQTGDDQ